MNEERYYAEFKYKEMELDGEFSDLSEAKKWIRHLLEEFPQPSIALIVDQEQEKVIYQEIDHDYPI
jgi:hypothetical protein